MVVTSSERLGCNCEYVWRYLIPEYTAQIIACATTTPFLYQTTFYGKQQHNPQLQMNYSTAFHPLSCCYPVNVQIQSYILYHLHSSSIRDMNSTSSFPFLSSLNWHGTWNFFQLAQNGMKILFMFFYACQSLVAQQHIVSSCQACIASVTSTRIIPSTTFQIQTRNSTPGSK